LPNQGKTKVVPKKLSVKENVAREATACQGKCKPPCQTPNSKGILLTAVGSKEIDEKLGFLQGFKYG
jgi:hypothetical protein